MRGGVGRGARAGPGGERRGGDGDDARGEAAGAGGDEFTDGAGETHPGLISTGLPVLRAAADQLPALRAKALEAEIGVIGFPRFGQTTTDYEHFRAVVAETPSPDYLGLAFYGDAKTVRRLTGSLGLLR